MSPLLHRANWLIVLLGLLHVAFLNSLIQIFWTSHMATVVLLVLPLVAAALTVGLVISAGLMWWRKMGSVAGRVYFSLLGLVAVLFIGFLHCWNFLGFRFG